MCIRDRSTTRHPPRAASSSTWYSPALARPDGLLVVDLPYFERDEPLVWEDGGTYVETDVVFTANTSHEWNHGLGEIVTALISQGCRSPGWSSTTACPGRLCWGR